MSQSGMTVGMGVDMRSMNMNVSNMNTSGDSNMNNMMGYGYSENQSVRWDG